MYLESLKNVVAVAFLVVLLINGYITQCSFQDCVVPDGSTLHEMCHLTSSFVDCLNKSFVQNNQCTIPIREDWRNRIVQIQRLIQDKGCFKSGQAGHLDKHTNLTSVTVVLTCVLVAHTVTSSLFF
nr:hypothetical protein BgiMline_029518 [Biomphalaria glabrata]